MNPVTTGAGGTVVGAVGVGAVVVGAAVVDGAVVGAGAVGATIVGAGAVGATGVQAGLPVGSALTGSHAGVIGGTAGGGAAGAGGVTGVLVVSSSPIAAGSVPGFCSSVIVAPSAGSSPAGQRADVSGQAGTSFPGA